MRIEDRIKAEEKIKILNNKITALIEEENKMDRRYKTQSILIKVFWMSKELLEKILKDFDNEKFLKKVDSLIETIEELKNINKPKADCAESIERAEEMVNMKWVNHNYIGKDKIKAKIEELDENGYWEFLEKRDEDKCKDILQSLLEKE